MPFVLDNSVVYGWFLGDQANAYTESIGQRLIDDRAFVPAIQEMELANVLRTACRRQRLDAARAQDILAQLARLPIEVDPARWRPAELLTLSLRFNVSSYDACYLALALQRQLPIASRDHSLREAALASGVGIVS